MGFETTIYKPERPKNFEVIRQYKKEYPIADDTVNDRLGTYAYDSNKGGKPAFSNGKYYIFYDSSNGWLWETSFNPYYIRSANWDLGTAEEFASFVGFETENITWCRGICMVSKTLCF